MTKPQLLINLPSTFFTHVELIPYFDHLHQLAVVKTASHETHEQIAVDLPWAEALIMWASPNLTDELLENAKNLRFVGQINTTQTTAMACLKRGIALSEVRHCWSPAVAEMALGLILSGLRKISTYHEAMRNATEKWVIQFPEDIDPQERALSGCTVGIVGFGGIGQRLAELLQPFHCKLFVYDPYVPEAVFEKYRAQSGLLLELLQTCEVVVLCAANTEEARHLIDRQGIAVLKKDCVLVNVGRSMLVDMQALEERLARGELIAMLDVFDEEPLPKDSSLRKYPNVFLTPHRAGGILASVKKALSMLTEDFEAFLEGRERKYAVTQEMLVCFAK